MPNDSTLDWQDGQPYSRIYQDVYFSKENGLEETRHVFLRHNSLHERWSQLSQEVFTIAETGFGTGLNFLCAWELWNRLAPAPARLHFVSTEKYPLSTDELRQSLALWPELSALSSQLLLQYRLLAPGWHRLVFDQGRVTLTLIIGDARDTLPQLQASVDAWFLDGFAPAKNPEMWQPELFSNMARLSHGKSTFATFTSAGDVRRGLQSAGFEVRKVAGFGAKREMLAGHYTAGAKPDFCTHKRAIVIGGGIAGTSSARALAVRGWQVTLLERHADIAQEASGNQIGVLYPRLTGQDIALGNLAQHGFIHSHRLLRQLTLPSHEYGECGLLQLAFDVRERQRCEAVASRQLPPELVQNLTPDEAGRLAGIPLRHHAIFLPAAGWVNPAAFCRALADHPNIRLATSTAATSLQKLDGVWRAMDQGMVAAEGSLVILAGAVGSNAFPQTAHLPLQPVRGQISFAPADDYSRQLQTVVCADGYISPPVEGVHGLGATFSAEDSSPDVRDSDHLENLSALKTISPELHRHLAQQPMQGRVAFRAVTPDYLPMTGPVLDAGALTSKPPRHTADPATLPWLDGLYVNTGHGSKGLIYAPYCAEMLASAISHEPVPSEAKLLAALDPNRFLLRKLGLKRLVQGLAVFPYCKMR